MELGYEDFPDSSAVGRLLPADGDRYYRAHKLFRIGGITAGVVGALALIGVVSTVQVTPAAAPSSQIATFSSTPAVVKDYGKMMASRQTGRFQALASSAPDTRVFDDAGRFIMHDFDRAKPMASFLPGVVGCGACRCGPSTSTGGRAWRPSAWRTRTAGSSCSRRRRRRTR
jgi:hypothetical protein